MTDKEYERINQIGSTDFQEIIIKIASMLYDYGIHLLSGEFRKNDVVPIINDILNGDILDYIFFDRKTNKFYRLILNKITIVDINKSNISDECGLLINTTYDVKAKLVVTLDDNYELPDNINSICIMHEISSQTFMNVIKDSGYFTSIIPNTDPNNYYPVDKLSVYDGANLINIYSIFEILTYGIITLQLLSNKAKMVGDHQLIIPKETLMSIQLFLQDASTKFSMMTLRYVNGEPRVVYVLPMICYDSIITDSYEKQKMEEKYNIIIDKNEYVLGTGLLDFIFGRFMVLRYQNS